MVVLINEVSILLSFSLQCLFSPVNVGGKVALVTGVCVGQHVNHMHMYMHMEWTKSSGGHLHGNRPSVDTCNCELHVHVCAQPANPIPMHAVPC